ncbi:MAG: 5-formyltetrahydrofolate cyclo-ligase [Gammaproteobacteria bacterium]|nr:5-formyltetrahydrofolate cyclo-ligase [Gammaproteobacteria bacterium]MYK82707.1 5-formyltetrahydrofolate cyclo-ligase [Gammaproteobacteria bacterium]
MLISDERLALRRRHRSVRRRLSAGQQWLHAEAVRRFFLASPLAWRSRRIAAYLGVDGEVNLRPLLDSLQRMGKLLALPVVERSSYRMSFFAHRLEAPLTRNHFGIEEPAPGAPWINTRALDLVLAPLVAFDDQGNRLGMGGGFYDRHFGALPERLRPLLVGVAHEVQRADALPAAPWDVPLDGILTEAGWRAFSPRLGL